MKSIIICRDYQMNQTKWKKSTDKISIKLFFVVWGNSSFPFWKLDSKFIEITNNEKKVELQRLANVHTKKPITRN